MVNFLGQNRKTLGAFLPEEVVDLVALLCTAQKISKTDLLSYLVIDHLKASPSRRELLDTITSQIITTRKVDDKAKEMSVNAYLGEIKSQLRKRKLADTDRTEIMQKVEAVLREEK